MTALQPTPAHLVAPPYPVTTSRVPPAVCHPVGEHAHRAAVEQLLASYRSIPVGATVRLAKRTSNLFRPRSTNSTKMPTGNRPDGNTPSSNTLDSSALDGSRGLGGGLDSGGLDSGGLDVDRLRGVVSIDVGARTADVQGMCTYEDLLAVTLGYGLMPLVVPQLRTITLGGAVTGLGIESSSFRNGLPHESVLELDILTGAGELVTATPHGEHADLFRAFPNSFGSLGYATRLRIELQPVEPVVALRHVHFGNLDQLAAAIETICATGEWTSERIDFLDGVVFSEHDAYLTLGQWSSHRHDVSDYTGRKIYYRSIAEVRGDALTVHDYLWRWDTDWFWCSKAFGAQNPVLRRLWPARLRRSDVFHRIVDWESRHRVIGRLDAWRGRPPRERVVQDVEVPVGGMAAFLRWYLDRVAMTPVWLCPLRLRDDGPLGTPAPGTAPWSLYPLRTGTTYVNIGFWGTVSGPGASPEGGLNREIEARVAELGGHKSLYSEAYYDEATFAAAYGGADYRAMKTRYDPQGRLTGLYEKVVGNR